MGNQAEVAQGLPDILQGAPLRIGAQPGQCRKATFGQMHRHRHATGHARILQVAHDRRMTLADERLQHRVGLRSIGPDKRRYGIDCQMLDGVDLVITFFTPERVPITGGIAHLQHSRGDQCPIMIQRHRTVVVHQGFKA
ncbi:hypothetical protein D3C78_1395870 [compost metagenome]